MRFQFHLDSKGNFLKNAVRVHFMSGSRSLDYSCSAGLAFRLYQNDLLWLRTISSVRERTLHMIDALSIILSGLL